MIKHKHKYGSSIAARGKAGMPRLIAHPAIFPAAATALIIALVTMAMTIAGLYQSRAAMVSHTLEVERELARLFARPAGR